MRLCLDVHYVLYIPAHCCCYFDCKKLKIRGEQRCWGANSTDLLIKLIKLLVTCKDINIELNKYDINFMKEWKGNTQEFVLCVKRSDCLTEVQLSLIRSHQWTDIHISGQPFPDLSFYSHIVLVYRSQKEVSYLVWQKRGQSKVFAYWLYCRIVACNCREV